MSHTDPAPQNTRPEAVRRSSLPPIPPPEWQFHTWFPTPDGGGDFVPGQLSRGAQVRRRVAYGDWEPVRPDHWAPEPASEGAGQARCDTAIDTAQHAPGPVGEALVQRVADTIYDTYGQQDTDRSHRIARAVLAELAPELADHERHHHALADAVGRPINTPWPDLITAAFRAYRAADLLSGAERERQDAEAKLTRIRELAGRWDLDAPPPGNRPLTELRRALDPPAPAAEEA